MYHLSALFIFTGILQNDPAVARVATTIREVTVYPSQALVTRAGKVNIQQTQTRFEFAELPNALRDDSIRVRASKGAVVGVEVVATQRTQTSSASVDALRDERNVKQNQRAALADEIAAQASLQQFIDALRAEAPTSVLNNSTPGQAGAPAQSAATIYQFISDRLPGVLAELRKLRDQDAQLAAEITALVAKLSQLQEGRVVPAKSVFIDVVAQPGETELDISYLIDGAGWAPSYDLRTAENLKSANLLMYGVVAQRTGEDWKQVQLTLSTAKPEHGAQAPVAETNYLAVATADYRAAAGYFSGVNGAGARGFAGEDEKERRKNELRDESKGFGITNFGFADLKETETDAFVASSGISTQLKVPRNEDVPADGRPHRVRVTEVTLPLEPIHTAVPKLTSRAFVQAKPKNTAGFPILAGPAQVFVGSDFVGRSNLAEVPAGEPIELSLGADPGITVERIKDKADREAPGFLGSRVKWTFKYRIIVKNVAAATEAANVEISETIPVSRDDRIKVDIANSDPPHLRGEKEDKDRESKGILKWRLPLARGESKTITISYTVSVPEKLEVAGLEK
ncbi:MAG: DUF4139 domain-containing protein [Planctomycetes bacterium]|nr:DUF4139 domain-containing protein [Planctomycetota bacterium]